MHTLSLWLFDENQFELYLGSSRNLHLAKMKIDNERIIQYLYENNKIINKDDLKDNKEFLPISK